MILLKKDKTIVSILLIAFTFTMPFGLVKNLNSISIIALTVFTIFLSIKNRFVLLKKKQLQVLPLVYFFFLVFTLIYSEKLPESIKQLEKSLPFLLFPLIFHMLKEYINEKMKKKIVFSFVLGNLLALFICLFYAVYVFYLESNNDPLFKGSFYFSDLIDFHPTYFSMYLIMCIVFIRIYLSENKTNLKWINRTILIILTVFLWASIIHLRSRSSIFALLLIEIILIASVFLNRYPKVNKKLFWLILVAFVTFIVYFTIHSKIYDYGKEYFKRDTSEAIDNRLKNWNASFDAIFEAPFLGNGLHDSRVVRDKYFYVNGYDVGVDKKYNSHNQFIESTMIGGVFGLSILLLILFKFLILYEKTNKPILLCFFTILFVVMMTESILIRQHGIVFLCFFYVFLLQD